MSETQITVLFFAKLAEDMGERELTLAYSEEVSSIEKLVAYLSQQNEKWAKALSSIKLMSSINHTMTKLQDKIEAGDEVGLFPPVTGG